MKNLWISLLAVTGIVTAAVATNRPPESPAPVAELVAPVAAPQFTLSNAKGKSISLESFKGKYVVLEWWNHECPYVARHYANGGMQKLQKDMADKKVVWLTINSSAPGKQGHVMQGNAKATMDTNKGVPAEILLDPSGVVGKKFGAKTTPHMYLISPKGELIYNGAIDSNRSGNDSQSVNYLVQAYIEATSGKAVSMPNVKPYGCSVKYAE